MKKILTDHPNGNLAVNRATCDTFMTCYKPHNWLIRNGYKDESYQESVYGQEIYEP